MTEQEKIISLARECGIYHRNTPEGTDEMWCFETDLLVFYHKAQREAYEKAAAVCDQQHDRARTSAGAARANSCATAIRILKEQS